MSPSPQSPWDAYEDDHTRDPLIITTESGKQETLYYKKTPDPIEQFYAKKDGRTKNLDSLDLKYWLAEIEKRRKQIWNYVDLAASTGQKRSVREPALDRARIAVQAVVLVDTYEQLIEHFEKPAEKEIKRLGEGFQQGSREVERVKMWRTLMESFHMLRDEAQSMAENMEFGVGTRPLSSLGE